MSEAAFGSRVCLNSADAAIKTATINLVMSIGASYAPVDLIRPASLPLAGHLQSILLLRPTFQIQHFFLEPLYLPFYLLHRLHRYRHHGAVHVVVQVSVGVVSPE